MPDSATRAPKVSVNIPVYNGEKFIARAIESVLAQTFGDFEIVVVNDGSKDSTGQIINSFTDPRVRAIHQEQNRGISRTRNNALRNSRGEYVAVLDADDLALPRRLEAQLDAFAKDPALDGTGAWFEYFREDPNRPLNVYLPSWDPSEMREVILFENPFGHSTMCVKREVLAAGGGYREDLACAEDYAKWLELVFAPRRMGVVREKLVRGWDHPPSNYTTERMRANVKILQADYFKNFLGRPLADEEAEVQWTLYEVMAWVPRDRQEAESYIRRARRWIKVLSEAELTEPTFDQERFVRVAYSRLYLMCRQAAGVLGLTVPLYAGRQPLEKWLKLLVWGALRRPGFKQNKA